jgi:hypothetical protein
MSIRIVVTASVLSPCRSQISTTRVVLAMTQVCSATPLIGYSPAIQHSNDRPISPRWLTTSRGSDALTDKHGQVDNDPVQDTHESQLAARRPIGVNRFGNVARRATTARTNSHSAHRRPPQNIATRRQRPKWPSPRPDRRFRVPPRSGVGGRAQALRGSVVLGHPATADPDARCLVPRRSSRPDHRFGALDPAGPRATRVRAAAAPLAEGGLLCAPRTNADTDGRRQSCGGVWRSGPPPALSDAAVPAVATRPRWTEALDRDADVVVQPFRRIGRGEVGSANDRGGSAQAARTDGAHGRQVA